MKNMKLLFFQWDSFMNHGIEKALQELGRPYDIYFYKFTDWEKDDSFLERFDKLLREKEYNIVLSVNYSPLISEVCQSLKRLYISWVYDSPIHIRNSDSLYNSYNRAYFFDRGQVNEYRLRGIDARHLPLAVDAEVFETTRKKIKRNYEADVSMVGKMYQTEYKDCIAPLDEYHRGYLEGIIKVQSRIYGSYLLPELVTEDFVKRINADYQKKLKGQFQIDIRELEFLLACEITGRERYLALALLSKYYNVHLYSSDKEEQLTNVVYKGYADYYSEMPNVFMNSRINLNISLKAIRTGIPLRVIDVMGCGGFVLSNYQEEMPEYFELGKECMIYEDMNDLFEKADYYLRHPEERERIAEAGLERVKKDFTFKSRIETMLKDCQ